MVFTTSSTMSRRTRLEPSRFSSDSIPRPGRRRGINLFVPQPTRLVFGDTNAHRVLEAGPSISFDESPDAPDYLVPVTAPDTAGVGRVLEQFRDWIRKNASGYSLREVVRSLLTGRRRFKYGNLMLVRDMAELGDRIGHLLSGGEPKRAGKLSLPAQSTTLLWTANLQRCLAAD